MKIGVDLGGSHIAVGLIEDKKIISKKERDFVSDDRENIEEAIENSIVEYTNELLKQNNMTINDIEKIGIAAPGTCSNGMIVKAENLGLYDFSIVDKLKKNFNIEITLNNDGNCAAMCEKIYGNLKSCDDGLFICLGTGVGGAVFLEGKLLKAKKYDGFELRTRCN